MVKRTRTHRNRTHRSKCMYGGRGGMGGAELGHAYTTGASQELYQLTGRTPGLSSGGKRNTRTRKQRKTQRQRQRRR